MVALERAASGNNQRDVHLGMPDRVCRKRKCFPDQRGCQDVRTACSYHAAFLEKNNPVCICHRQFPRADKRRYGKLDRKHIVAFGTSKISQTTCRIALEALGS